jgi:hypothetical protein
MPKTARSLLISIAISITAYAQQVPTTTFGVAGAIVRPFAINAQGQVAGLYRDGNGVRGFLRDTDGTYTFFSVPFAGATFTNATGINARGQIVGRWTDASGNARGYLRTPDGKITSFDPLDPCAISRLPAAPHGINDAGDIVGRCFDSAGNEHGYLMGTDGAFAIIDVDGALTTDAWMVNNAGEIVGDYSDSNGVVHGYRRSADGQFTTISVPGMATTSARSINDRGDVAGVYRSSADPNPQTMPGDGGFVLRAQTFTTIPYPENGIGLGHVAINARGLIVADYITDMGTEGGFLLLISH